MNSSELEERLINFAVQIIDIANEIPNTIVGGNLAKQIGRSGTSSALNYGEARGAESMKDFAHKIQIVVKELRETHVCLKILTRARLIKSNHNMQLAMDENNQLISILVKTVKTSQARINKN